MEAVSSHPQVHPRLVFLSGFSAGAYAITELLAVGIPFPVASIVFGGVHGHGNATDVCNSLALSNVVRERTPEFDGKWRAYLSRLSLPSDDDIRSIVVVHNKRDLMSPWIAAEPIIHAIDQSRAWHDSELVRQVVFTQEKSNKNKNAHQYWRRVHEELFEEILLARSILVTETANEPQATPSKPKKSKRREKIEVALVEAPATSSLLTSCSSSSSSSFRADTPRLQGQQSLPVVPEVSCAPRLATVIEVEVTSSRQRERYEKPAPETIEALRQALFSSLPPEDYLRRKATAEAFQLRTSCPVEPSLTTQMEIDTIPNWTGITGLVGTIRPVTLLLPPEEDLQHADLTGDLPLEGLWKVVAKEAVLRTSASTSSPIIGKVPKGTIVRVIGNPRYFQSILRARAEVISHHPLMGGLIGYLTLNGMKAGGPTICETEGPDAMDAIRDPASFKEWQEGLGASIDDDDMPDEDMDLTHAEQCFARHDIAKLRSMLVAALPLKEHFLALHREEDQRIIPMNKHDKVDYEIPLATCLRVSPWSYVLSFGADSDELIPADTRHIGGSSLSSSSSSCCISSWIELRHPLVSALHLFPCRDFDHSGGGLGAESLCTWHGSPSSSSSSFCTRSDLTTKEEQDEHQLPTTGCTKEEMREDNHEVTLRCTNLTSWKTNSLCIELAEEFVTADRIAKTIATRKKIALPRIVMDIAGEMIWDFDLIFLTPPSSEIFYDVLPPLPDRKKRKR
eukprot:3876901-Amphidinium_carterae.1